MEKFFLELDVRVQTALIAAVVGLLTGFVGPLVKHWLDRWGLRHRLSTEYQYEERKKLRELIGGYHGRILEISENLNHRLWNLQLNESKMWLKVDGNYNNPNKYYYFTSMIHRMVSLFAVIRDFQSHAIYIDARIAEKNDLLFLKYAKALEWSLTDAKLFDGLPYDDFHETDHVFSGNLHVICEVCWSGNGPVTIKKFHDMLLDGSCIESLESIFKYFDGLCKNEDRYRWGRLIVFHLILMSFINDFGYDVQYSSEEKLKMIACSVKNKEILENLYYWIEKLGLDKSDSGKSLKKAIYCYNN